MQRIQQRLLTFVLVCTSLTGCGGGGSGNSSVTTTPNAIVAAQVADITPGNTQDTVSVFVALDNTTAISALDSVFQSSDQLRAQSQQNFLDNLQNVANSTLSAATGSTCTTSDLATRISQAHTPSSGNAVRIDLNACELALLSKLKGVTSIFPDIPMSTQSVASATLSKTISTTKMSFNGSVEQPTLGANSADGAGQIVAILDTGVEERHPALGSSKVLSGACFSTASNSGHGFCPNGLSSDTTSALAARSCADTWSGTRAEAVQAGCGHGTSMAAAASMRYTSSDNVAIKGIAPNAQVLPVQVFNQSITSSGKALSSSAGDLLAAVEWLTTEAQRRRTAGLAPIVAMNMSLGGGSYTSACDSDYVGSLFKTAFTNLRIQGVLPVVAAGNGGTKNAISFPACVSNTVSVAAAKLNDTALASYSNFSSQVKLMAIGGDVDGTGRYVLPVLCATSGSFDCWQELAGTSPATALTTGGVAALFSVKTGASLSGVETALTTDIAALNLNGSSSLHLTVNDGTQNITRPALRLTASAYQLLNLTESNGSGTPPPSTVTPPVSDTVISQAQICLFSTTGFKGTKACAVQGYGANAPSTSKDLFYRYFGRVGSISITDLQTGSDLASGTASVTIYAGLNALSRSASLNASNANTSSATGSVNPIIGMVRIQTQ
jgi:hypothetical protein